MVFPGGWAQQLTMILRDTSHGQLADPDEFLPLRESALLETKGDFSIVSRSCVEAELLLFNHCEEEAIKFAELSVVA
jgi:hypothetical protein